MVCAIYNLLEASVFKPF